MTSMLVETGKRRSTLQCDAEHDGYERAAGVIVIIMMMIIGDDGNKFFQFAKRARRAGRKWSGQAPRGRQCG